MGGNIEFDEEELKRNNDVLKIIDTLLNQSLKNDNLDHIMDEALDIILSIPSLPFLTAGCIFLVEDEPETLVLKSMKGFPAIIHKRCPRVPFGRCLCGQAALTKEILFADNTQEVQKSCSDNIFFHNHYCVPIVFADKTIGVVNLSFERECILNKREKELITTITCILADVIIRKRAVKLLEDINEKEKLLDEAIEYQKLKTECFTNVSHELRTPLTLMFTTLQMLELYVNNNVQVCNGEKVDKHIKTLKQNCYRLLRLINNLIDSTKIDAGYFQINLKNQNIVSIVENITLSVVEHVENKGLKLIFDTDVEEKIIACDLDKVERIMLNLLSNAVKFTSQGGSIMINLHDRGDNIVISVKDTGIGIPEDKCEEVFERFRQVDNSLMKAQYGSGIGLSLVKSLVEIHGGKISLKSEYGKGSEFIVVLPVRLTTGKNNVFDNDNNDKQHNSIERINIEFSDIYS